MTTWHGYEQADGAHPERPWWRRVHVELGSTNDEGFLVRSEEWRRTDGTTARRTVDGWAEPAHPANLDDIDRTNPLPAPPPRCGQVWHDPDPDQDDPGGDYLITFAPLPGSASFPRSGSDIGFVVWPPPGCVLVAGPGSPWSPP